MVERIHGDGTPLDRGQRAEQELGAFFVTSEDDIQEDMDAMQRDAQAAAERRAAQERADRLKSDKEAEAARERQAEEEQKAETEARQEEEENVQTDKSDGRSLPRRILDGVETVGAVGAGVLVGGAITAAAVTRHSAQKQIQNGIERPLAAILLDEPRPPRIREIDFGG